MVCKSVIEIKVHATNFPNAPRKTKIIKSYGLIDTMSTELFILYFTGETFYKIIYICLWRVLYFSMV